MPSGATEQTSYENLRQHRHLMRHLLPEFVVDRPRLELSLRGARQTCAPMAGAFDLCPAFESARAQMPGVAHAN